MRAGAELLIKLALVRKSIHESRWLWLACAACLFLFCWIHVSITSDVDMSRFQDILESLPTEWEKLSPVPFDQMVSYPARIAVTYEEPIVFILMSIWCTARSSDVVSGQLGRGTMELVLSQPVSRLQVMWSHVLVTIVGMGLLAAVAWLGTTTGIMTSTVEHLAEAPSIKIPFTEFRLPLAARQPKTMPMRELADYRLFIPIALNYYALGFALCGITTFFSSWDRVRWRTIGLTASFLIVSMLLELLGTAVDQFAWVKNFTILQAYEPVSFAVNSIDDLGRGWSWLETTEEGEFSGFGPSTFTSLLMAIGVVFFAAAAVIFRRRDLPAPI